MNQAFLDMLELFKYDHLPEHLQNVSKPFHDLAWEVAQRPTQRPAEVMASLRKLREAKDCAVCAAIPLGEREPEPDKTQPPDGD